MSSDTDNDDYSDYLEYYLNKDYSVSCDIRSADSDIMINHFGHIDLGFNKYWGTVTVDNTVYLDVFNKEKSATFEDAVQYYRDMAYDFDLRIAIVDYEKPGGLSFYNNIKGIKVYFSIRVAREDSNPIIENLDLRITLDDNYDSVSEIDGDECNYYNYYDSYEYYTSSEIISRVGNGKFIEEIQAEAEVDGNWRTRKSYIIIDYFKISYVLDEDM